MELNQNRPKLSQNASQQDHPDKGKAAHQEPRSNLDKKVETREPQNPYISVYSLLLTSLQLIELYDHQPGNQKRFARLNELVEEIRQFTSLGRA